MPIYRYRCDSCDEVVSAMHLSSELMTDCTKCGSVGSLSKLMNKVYIKKNDTTSEDNQNVGTLTHQFIEDNREILRKQKEEAKDKQYDKS